MKFACNYSSVLMHLIEEEKVDVDFIKMGYFGPFMGLHDMVARHKDILIHGFGRYEHIGMVNPEGNNDWDMMNKVLSKYKNDHLAVHYSIYDQDMIGNVDPYKRLEEGIQTFKKHIDVPLMIENMDHNPMYNRMCVRKEGVDPDFFSEMCEKYDLAVLLDTAHASVTAYHLQMDVRDYISKLPLDRVKEVHFVGTQMTDDQGLKDMHTPLESRDYQLLDWLSDRVKPEIITLEYGWPGDEYAWRTREEAIVDQLMEIRKKYE